MKIEVDSDGKIIAYSIIGSIEGGIEVAMPDEFEKNFKPGYFLYEDGVIRPESNYTDSSSIVINTPTAQQAINANLLLQIANLAIKVDALKGEDLNG